MGPMNKYIQRPVISINDKYLRKEGGYHTDCHLRQARARLAKKPIRRKPGSVGILLHILAQTYINGIMILRHIPIDVVKAAIAYLDRGFQILGPNTFPNTGPGSRLCK